MTIRPLFIATLALVGMGIGCATTKPIVIPPITVTMRAVAVVVTDGEGRKAGALVTLNDITPPGPHTDVTGLDGVVTFPMVSGAIRSTQVSVKVFGCQDYVATIELTENISQQVNIGGPQTTANAVQAPALDCRTDPSSVPLQQLAAIRGAMWPSASRCPSLRLPFGPRPNQPDNIIATDFFANYSPEDQNAILDCLRSLGYTHVVMGPLVDSDGYHGQYQPHDWTQHFDQFLDTAQTFWDSGLTPVVFLHPDGWTFEETRDRLTPLLMQPRAQQLLRIVVPTGWEPTRYGWSSCTWAAFAQWARETLPNALVLIHTVADVDAPVGTDARCDDNGKPNGEGWARVTPYIHGWLIQNGDNGGSYSQSPAQNPSLAKNFAAQFKADGDGAAQHSIGWHFAGNAGWPTNSAWGPHIPIRLYAGETTSYAGYWQNMPEDARIQWGDLAIASGASGYLDGGTVAVPVR